MMKQKDSPPSSPYQKFVISILAIGLLTAGFADRNDRKKLLVFFYFGFIAGDSIFWDCNSYITRIAARLITGLFGGVIGVSRSLQPEAV